MTSTLVLFSRLYDCDSTGALAPNTLYDRRSTGELAPNNCIMSLTFVPISSLFMYHTRLYRDVQTTLWRD